MDEHSYKKFKKIKIKYQNLSKKSSNCESFLWQPIKIKKTSNVSLKDKQKWKEKKWK